MLLTFFPYRQHLDKELHTHNGQGFPSKRCTVRCETREPTIPRLVYQTTVPTRWPSGQPARSSGATEAGHVPGAAAASLGS